MSLRPTTISADLADKISTYLIRCAIRSAPLNRYTDPEGFREAHTGLRDALSRHIAAKLRRPEVEAWPAIDEYLEDLSTSTVIDLILVSDVVATVNRIVSNLRQPSPRRTTS